MSQPLFCHTKEFNSKANMERYLEEHRDWCVPSEMYIMQSIEKMRPDCTLIKHNCGYGWYFGPRDRKTDGERVGFCNPVYFCFMTADGVWHGFDVSTNELTAKVNDILENFIKTGVIDMNTGETVILQDEEDLII